MANWKDSEIVSQKKRFAYDKAAYVPLSEREWDGKVIVAKPYKDHEWTGLEFDSKLGRRCRD